MEDYAILKARMEKEIDFLKKIVGLHGLWKPTQ